MENGIVLAQLDLTEPTKEEVETGLAIEPMDTVFIDTDIVTKNSQNGKFSFNKYKLSRFR